jgi:hypothetical protein
MSQKNSGKIRGIIPTEKQKSFEQKKMSLEDQAFFLQFFFDSGTSLIPLED